MSPYRLAIDQTTQTIDNRAKQFRNLIVAVTFVGLGSILWAGIAWSWLPLVGIFLLVPVCGLYFFFDAKLLNQWQHELMAAWVKREVDFRALYEAVIPISTLPKDTVNSMLETLPSAGDLVAEQSVSASTREAIAAVVTMIHACRSDHIAFKAAGYTIVGSLIVVAAAFWMWQPLVGMLAVGLSFIIQQWVKTKRLKGAGKKIQTAQLEPDFSTEIFLEILNQINWSPISTTEKEAFLATLSDAS